jgi:Zn-finger domain-containing protein
MSALKNYTLASDNANDFHKRVDVLLLQALQIITTDTLETMSSQTISLRKSYFSRVFQDQFKESQKVAKYLAKIWDEADINIDSTDVNSDDATIKKQLLKIA